MRVAGMQKREPVIPVAGLVPAIRVSLGLFRGETWMPGIKPGMTK